MATRMPPRAKLDLTAIEPRRLSVKGEFRSKYAILIEDSIMPFWENIPSLGEPISAFRAIIDTGYFAFTVPYRLIGISGHL